MTRVCDRLLLVLAALFLSAFLPVETRYNDGVIDWTQRVVRVVGVGTPKVLSATASRTPFDTYTLARADAQARLVRLLKRLQLAEGTGRAPEQQSATFVESVAAGFLANEALRFSDGTVHLPAVLPFAGIVATPGSPPNRPKDESTGLPLGLEIHLNESCEPNLGLRVSAGETEVMLGYPDSTRPPIELVWIRKGVGEAKLDWGEVRPARVNAKLQRGGQGRNVTLALVEASQIVLDGLLAQSVQRVVVVLPPQADRVP